MVLLNGVISITGITFLMFIIFIVAGLGYLLGRVTIKGVSLGTAGVFIVALLIGAFCFTNDGSNLVTTFALNKGAPAEFSKNFLKIIENLGLIMFVTSVGFIAGPNFFSSLKKNFKSYALLSLIIILLGGLTTIFCIKVLGCGTSMAVVLPPPHSQLQRTPSARFMQEIPMQFPLLRISLQLVTVLLTSSALWALYFSFRSFPKYLRLILTLKELRYPLLIQARLQTRASISTSMALVLLPLQLLLLSVFS